MANSLFKITVSSPIGSDLVDEMVKHVTNLTETQVLVGVPQATAGRLAEKEGGRAVGMLSSAPDGGEDIANNNAALAYIHNFGAPEANIPARPFLVPGIQDAIPRLHTPLKQAAIATLNRRPADVMKALHAVGLICQNAVRRKITIGPFVPLAPSTVKGRMAKHPHRKAASASDMKPLIDTGRLRQAQTYAIEAHGQEVYTNPVEGGGRYSSVKGVPS